MSDAIYLTEETARLAASYIKGPQVQEVRIVRFNYWSDKLSNVFYQPVIIWKDGSVSGMKVWMAEWFSINANHGVSL